MTHQLCWPGRWQKLLQAGLSDALHKPACPEEHNSAPQKLLGALGELQLHTAHLAQVCSNTEQQLADMKLKARTTTKLLLPEFSEQERTLRGTIDKLVRILEPEGPHHGLLVYFTCRRHCHHCHPGKLVDMRRLQLCDCYCTVNNNNCYC